MALPAYFKDGYRPNGPGRIYCQFCEVTISSNALARASHERGKKHQENVDRKWKARHDRLMKKYNGDN